ncbi:MAG: lipopolysaccharide transport periplasmic protein LptA [Deltaproteobacteria bacterium RBG_13_65_10]|nr:MAG: lipopolysaccharide transport periplasmic protein LptA [Deltaproteobacteria bacterium RBG_13_65_10]
MTTHAWGGGTLVAMVTATWVLAVPGWGAQGKVKIAVAPLEVHASADTLADTAKEIRRALAHKLGGSEGIEGVESPKDQDVTSGPLTIPALQRSARSANAKYVLYGSVTQLGGTYSLDARLYDPAVGKAKAAYFREGVGREELLAKLDGLAQEVRRTVFPSAPVDSAPASAPASHDTAPGQVSAPTADSSKRAGGAREEESNPLGLRVRNSKQPIAITSDSLEAINKANTVVFRGNVEARQADLKIYCDVMTVLYAPDGKGIVKIIADRNVRIVRDKSAKAAQTSEAITATCAKGIYYNEQGRIVLKGNPVVRRGNDTVKGDEIVFFLDDNRFTVRQAKVTISPEGVKSLNQPGGGAETTQPRKD